MRTPRGRQKDSEARWTKKNNQAHYGWKNHVKVDLKTKLILKSRTTAANVHDSQVFEELLDEQDQAVLADSAYHSEKHEAHLIQLNAQEFLMRKATRGRPLSETEQRTNHTISRMRVRVEHIFARVAQMGATGVAASGSNGPRSTTTSATWFTTWTVMPAWFVKAAQALKERKQSAKIHLPLTADALTAMVGAAKLFQIQRISFLPTTG